MSTSLELSLASGKAYADVFKNAYATATKFTHPLVLSWCDGTGDVHTTTGAYVVVNGEWALTAAHIIDKAIELETTRLKWEEYAVELQAINDKQLIKANRQKEIAKLKKKSQPSDLVQALSLWLGHDEVRLGQYHLDRNADLAVFKYSDAPAEWSANFPKIRSGALEPGTSLLRIGYPFHHIEAQYDSNKFDLSKGMPIPIFPNEGIATRRLEIADAPNSYPCIFLETSSPGLKGQSGGPIVDTDGNLWAIQSQTRHLRLGFSPEINDGPKPTVEHQFLNVGYGTDAETIKAILDSKQITYELS